MKKLDYARGVLDYEVVRHFRPLPPRIFHFPVTYRCNGRCVMCNIWTEGKKSELSTGQIEKMLQDRLFSTITKVIITGGEPTLRSDLLDIVKLLVNCPNLRSLSLTTNGLIPSQVFEAVKGTLAICKAKNISVYCSVSLDGLGNFHEQVRGVKNAFEKTTETIERLRKLQLTEQFGLGVESVVTRFNVDNVTDLWSWLKERNLPNYFSPATFRKRNLNEELDFTISGDNLQKYLTFLGTLKAQNAFNAKYCFLYNALKKKEKRKILCPFSLEAISVDPDGCMYYCTDSKSIGNVTERPPHEIYFDKEHIKYRDQVRASICPTCLQTCEMDGTTWKQPLIWISTKIRN